MPLLNHLPYPRNRLQGFTLVELVMVIAVLAILAGLLLSKFGALRFSVAGQDRSAEQIATMATLGAVRSAIIGTPGQPGLWQDLGENSNLFPHTIADLFVNTNMPPALQSFNPVTRLGWRGPYLVPSGTVYSNNDVYGAPGDPAVPDAWGHPIVLQIPDWQHARLVSAGPNGVLDTPPADSSAASRNDDLILFLFVPDTNVVNGTSGP